MAQASWKAAMRVRKAPAIMLVTSPTASGRPSSSISMPSIAPVMSLAASSDAWKATSPVDDPAKPTVPTIWLFGRVACPQTVLPRLELAEDHRLEDIGCGADEHVDEGSGSERHGTPQRRQTCDATALIFSFNVSAVNGFTT